MEAEKNLAQSCAIFQFLGLLNFSIKNLSWKSLSQFPTMGYTITFVLLLMILTAKSVAFTVFMSTELSLSLSAKNALNYIMQHSMFIGLISVILTGLVQSYTSTKSLKRFFLNFIAISQLFSQEFQHILDFKRVKLELYRNCFRFTAIYLLITLLVYFYESYHGIGSVLKSTIGLVPIIFLEMIMFKFVFLVYLVNDALEHLVKVLDKTFLGNLGTKVAMVQPKHHISCKKLNTLRKIYSLVEENVELINKSMGFTLLSIIFLQALALITCGYRLFLTFVGRYPIPNTCSKYLEI